MDKEVKKNHDRKQLKRKLASKEKAKLRRKGSKIKQNRNLSSSYDNIIIIDGNFRFSSNKTLVLKRISAIEKALNREETVFVNLTGVTHIDLEAIVLLLGIMAEFRAKNILFNGNFPQNKVVKEQLMQSGFFKQLFPDSDYEHENFSFGSKKGIYTHGQKLLDKDLSADLISESLITVFGKKKRSQGAQRILIEAMKNTVQHAGNSRKEKFWWLSIRKDKKNKKVTFSFLDYGVGIFNSLKSKSETDPGYNALKKFLLGRSDASILEKIMEGKLNNISRTRKPQHGTGLPGMKTAIDNNFISKLVILSNNVYANVGSVEYEQLNVNFSGTLIQFEIIDTCKSFDYE